MNAPGEARNHALALRLHGGVRPVLLKLLALLAFGARRRVGQLPELVLRTGFVVATLFIFAQLWRVVTRDVNARPCGYEPPAGREHVRGPRPNVSAPGGTAAT